jgi:uncharacterized protein
MPVVSNTSPISNLAVIDRLELLRAQFGRIDIPPAVHAELGRLPHPDALQRLETAFHVGWLRVTPLKHAVPLDLASALDPGEAAALALALELNASLALLDESSARLHAARLGIAHVGILGVLLRAKNSGHLPSLTDEIRRLRAEARFFVGSALEKRLLAAAGE